MTAFDANDYRSAHVLLDLLAEREIPLSRDAMYALERIIVTSRWDRQLWTTPLFPGLGGEPVCTTCAATMVASRTVQVSDTEVIVRRMYECGAVEAEHSGALFTNELLAPCGDTERRMAAAMRARQLAESDDDDRCSICDGTGREHHSNSPPDGVECYRCDGTGVYRD